jgi:hypothetical protein
MLKENSEKRSCARLGHQAHITLESFEVGVLHEARMYNYSKSGLYFESDFYLVPGAEIFIGINNSPYTSAPGVYECYRSIIKWRKFLEHSAFDYGYGIELKARVLRGKKEGDSGESRSHPRTPCSIPTVIQSNKRRVRGVIQNVSYGGVFISCAEELSKGQRVFLTIPLKKKQKLVNRAGEIVWSDKNGVGIKFEAESADESSPTPKAGSSPQGS